MTRKLLTPLGLCFLLALGCSDTLEDSGDTQDSDTNASTPGECNSGERVEDHACVPCEPGQINEAGDPIDGENTACDPCEPGSFSASGEAC